jgi:hypothetical protein
MAVRAVVCLVVYGSARGSAVRLCGSVRQCVAVCGSVRQCSVCGSVAVAGSVRHYARLSTAVRVAVRGSVWQCVAVPAHGAVSV